MTVVMKNFKLVLTFILLFSFFFAGSCATKKKAYKDQPSDSVPSASAENTTQPVKPPVILSGEKEFVYEFDVMVDVDPQKMAEPRPDYPGDISPSDARSTDSYGQQSQQAQVTQGTGSAAVNDNAGVSGAAAGSNDSAAVNNGAGSDSEVNNIVVGEAGTLSGSQSAGSAANDVSVGSAAAVSTKDYASEYAAGFKEGFADGSQGFPNSVGRDGSGNQNFAGIVNGVNRSAAYIEGYNDGYAAVGRSGSAIGGVAANAGSQGSAGLGSAGTSTAAGSEGFDSEGLSSEGLSSAGLGSEGLGSEGLGSEGTSASSASRVAFAGTAAGSRAFGSPGGPGGERRRNSNLVGSGSVNVEGIMDYIKIRNRNPNFNEEHARRIINSYIDEAEKEGVNYDFAIAQMLYWTAFLTHKQRVDSNNFAGLDTTNNWNGTFRTAEEGVRAHIQHLRGYSHGALKDPSTKIIDPRWDHISHFRGTIKNFEQIYPRWSQSTARYRRNIILILNDSYRYSERYSNLYR